MALIQPNLTPLGGLHFLIHPFFNAAPGPFEKILSEKEFNEKGRPPGFIYMEQAEIEEDLRQYPLLAETYLERASKVGPNEALAVFLSFEHGAASFYDERFEPLVTGFLTELQNIVGGRLLLFDRDNDPMLGPEVASAVRRALALRGWRVSPETPSYAFGESLDHCIPESVQNLREGFGLRKPTLVNPLFTDWKFQWPGMSDTERRHLRADLFLCGISLIET